DLKLGFDPLIARLGDLWTGPSVASVSAPPRLPASSTASGEAGRGAIVDRASEAGEGGVPRTVGDVVEHLETLAAGLVNGTQTPDSDCLAATAVLATIEATIRPRLAASGPNEVKSLLDGLDGKFVQPGPSGAPSRGRLDVLPT